MAEIIYTPDGETPAQRRMAADLLASYPTCRRITFLRPPAGRGAPKGDEIIYVMAGHGARRSKARLLVGAALAADLRGRQKAEAEARRQARAEEEFPEWAALVRDWCGRYYRPSFRPDYSGRLVPALAEHTGDGAVFHSLYGSNGWVPPTAARLAEMEREAADWWASQRRASA